MVFDDSNGVFVRWERRHGGAAFCPPLLCAIGGYDLDMNYGGGPMVLLVGNSRLGERQGVIFT